MAHLGPEAQEKIATAKKLKDQGDAAFKNGDVKTGR
jgi:hypothetical protein